MSLIILTEHSKQDSTFAYHDKLLKERTCVGIIAITLTIKHSYHFSASGNWIF